MKHIHISGILNLDDYSAGAITDYNAWIYRYGLKEWHIHVKSAPDWSKTSICMSSLNCLSFSEREQEDIYEWKINFMRTNK